VLIFFLYLLFGLTPIKFWGWAVFILDMSSLSIGVPNIKIIYDIPSLLDCQTTCKNYIGCGYFRYNCNGHSCYIDTESGTIFNIPGSGMISGPPTCWSFLWRKTFFWYIYICWGCKLLRPCRGCRTASYTTMRLPNRRNKTLKTF